MIRHKYDPGLINEHCRRLRFKDDQFAFDRAGTAHTSPIFEIEDSTNTCAEEVEYATIKAISYPDLNADGFPDISITATLGTGRFTEPERLACRGGHHVFSGVGNEHRLNFLFDGKRFVVAPSSQATFRLFPDPTMPER